MDSTEARDKAALLCVPDIYRQTERGINYSEWGRSDRGGVIHWSVWLIGGLGQRGEKTTAVDRMGLLQRGSLTLADVWRALHFSHLLRDQLHPGSITATSARPPNMLVRTNYTIKVLKRCFKGSVHPNCKKTLSYLSLSTFCFHPNTVKFNVWCSKIEFAKPNIDASFQKQCFNYSG